MSKTVEAALARAAEAVCEGACAPEPAHTRASYVIGDPQTTARRFFEVLAHHRLLSTTGWLRPEVTLVSAGDHFDFRCEEHLSPRETGAEGLSILAWLCAHDARQVAVLLGNHDTARVMELAHFSDESFEAARREAQPLELRRKAGKCDSTLAPDVSSFLARWPALPSPEYVDRDCRTFATEQRSLLQRLLLARRVRLAVSVRLDEENDALVTHAGVTTRELAVLQLPADATPAVIDASLQTFLDERMSRAEVQWRNGERVPLDLSPLHRAGGRGEEGGGLLYHRPTHPAATNVDKLLHLRRRYLPMDLPRGLVQVVGHVGHGRLYGELAEWVTSSGHALGEGQLRTLHCDAAGVYYGAFERSSRPSTATMHFVDGAMNVTDPSAYELLEVVPTMWTTTRRPSGGPKPARSVA